MTTRYNVVSELQNYMFSSKIKEIPPPLTITPTKPATNTKSPITTLTTNHAVCVKQRDLFFSPHQRDSLFWCFYVMVNGITMYEMENASFEKEKAEKIKYIDILRSKKEVLKLHKINKLSDIESNLSLDAKLNQHSFFALCALENINAVILKNRVYADIMVDASKKTFVLHQTKEKFKLEYDASNMAFSTTHFKLPLKSISNYKLTELHDICSKLEIVIPQDCKKKQDIYVLITTNLNKIDCI